MASGQGGSPRGTVHSPLPHLCHQLMALAGWGPSYICEGGRTLCLDADPVWLHFFLGLYPGSRTVAGRGWPSLRSRQDWGSPLLQLSGIFSSQWWGVGGEGQLPSC